MPLKIFLKGDVEDEMLLKDYKRGEKFVKVSPIRVGIAGGITLVLTILLLFLFSYLGVLENLTLWVFQIHDISLDLGAFGFFLLGISAFLEGFAISAIFASVYRWIL